MLSEKSSHLHSRVLECVIISGCVWIIKKKYIKMDKMNNNNNNKKCQRRGGGGRRFRIERGSSEGREKEERGMEEEWVWERRGRGRGCRG